MNSPKRMKITVSTHQNKWAPAFKSLNLAWLKKYFWVEPIDEIVLSQPNKIIEAGGQIFYLIQGDDVIGCCALKQHERGVFELTKMAVDEAQQSMGLGHALMEKGIEWFKQVHGTKLYLETNSKLKPAIHLYQKFGFVAMPCPFDTDYQRADYYMEWRP